MICYITPQQLFEFLLKASKVSSSPKSKITFCLKSFGKGLFMTTYIDMYTFNHTFNVNEIHSLIGFPSKLLLRHVGVC